MQVPNHRIKVFCILTIGALYVLTSYEKITNFGKLSSGFSYLVEDKFRIQTTPSAVLRESMLSSTCEPQSTTVWEEWYKCISERYANLLIEPDQYLEQWSEEAGSFPWIIQEKYSAVMVEFRCDYPNLQWTLNNTINNLPVSWKIQILGSHDTESCVKKMFPKEVMMGKMLVRNLGIDNMAQTEISFLFTNKTFYEGLLGDVWLFFQTDSVICSKQRYLLHEFLAKDYGYWGAPWENGTENIFNIIIYHL